MISEEEKRTIIRQQFASYIDDPKYTPKQLKQGDIIEAIVIQVKKGMLIVDVGAKSEGIIAGRELQTQETDISMIKPGDKLLVYVIHPENDKGQVELSIRRTDIITKWARLKQAQKDGEVIEVTVLEANNGGVLADVSNGLAGFIPTSQLDSTRLYTNRSMENKQQLVQELPVRLGELIGQKIKTKIIEIDEEKNRIILSEKLVLNEGDIQQRKYIKSS